MPTISNLKMPVIAGLFAMSALVASCKKDEGKLPNISFKTDAGYISKDSTVAQGASVKIGINASKSESVDVLKTFNVTQSLDGAAGTTIRQETLSGGSGDNYSTDQNITTRTKAGTEKYTFTVTNRDGITNQLSLTLTTK